jgi:hypothetical protein
MGNADYVLSLKILVSNRTDMSDYRSLSLSFMQSRLGIHKVRCIKFFTTNYKLFERKCD